MITPIQISYEEARKDIKKVYKKNLERQISESDIADIVRDMNAPLIDFELNFKKEENFELFYNSLVEDLKSYFTKLGFSDFKEIKINVL